MLESTSSRPLSRLYAHTQTQFCHQILHLNEPYFSHKNAIHIRRVSCDDLPMHTHACSLLTYLYSFFSMEMCGLQRPLNYTILIQRPFASKHWPFSKHSLSHTRKHSHTLAAFFTDTVHTHTHTLASNKIKNEVRYRYKFIFDHVDNLRSLYA